MAAPAPKLAQIMQGNHNNISTIGNGRVVCVTGVTGFIGAHLVRLFLQRGYKVKGTARGVTTDRVRFLREFPHAKERLELVEADLLGSPGTFDSAVKGCDFVIHCASPFFVTVNDAQKDLVEPAMKGTLSVLGSCLKHQATITKVVITSSVAAITDSPDSSIVYSEKDWNLSSSLTRNPYYYSKVVAEKAAYEFVERSKAKFKLVSILPSMVLGPAVNPGVSESVALTVQAVANGEFPVIVDVAHSFVDVRDVALAHILALETDQAEGRYICAAHTVHLRDMFRIMHSKHPQVKVPWIDIKSKVGSNLVRTVGVYKYSEGMRDFIRTNIGRQAHYNNSRIQRDLGLQFRPLEDSIEDTTQDLLSRRLIDLENRNPLKKLFMRSKL